MPDYEINRWDSIGDEIFLYWWFMLIPYAVVMAVISLPLLGPSFRLRYLRYWQFSTLFPISMWFVGAYSHALWSKYIWGHYYYSPDYMVDFLPFLPILRAQVEASFGNVKGKLLGDTSMFDLRLLWFYFALATWLGSWLLFRLMRRAMTALTLPDSNTPQSNRTTGVTK